jgi:chloramphenicol O-acetyltransferase type A
MGHFLELQGWRRREHFELFRNVSQPFFGVTVNLDVTRLLASTRTASAAHGRSFTIAGLYHLMRACRETPAFCLRARAEGVWVHDTLRLSTTVMRSDDTFGFAVFRPAATLEEFHDHARAEVARASTIAPLTVPEGDDIVYHSTLPWLRFTAFTNAIDVGANSVPRVVFGQRFADGDHWRMPIGVEVHHALVDGIDVARFLERLQAGFDGTLP